MLFDIFAGLQRECIDGRGVFVFTTLIAPVFTNYGTGGGGSTRVVY